MNIMGSRAQGILQGPAGSRRTAIGASLGAARLNGDRQFLFGRRWTIGLFSTMSAELDA